MAVDGPGDERKITNEMVTCQGGVNRGASTGFRPGRATEAVGMSGVGRYGANALVRGADRSGLSEAQISRFGRDQEKLARLLGIEPKMRAAMPRVSHEAIMEELS